VSIKAGLTFFVPVRYVADIKTSWHTNIYRTEKKTVCKSLFVLLYFFFWPLCGKHYFDLRILSTRLVSSNSTYRTLRDILALYEEYIN